MKNYIYIQGFGFVRKEKKNSFREKKMEQAWGREYLPVPIGRKSSQETDLN
jgi:hypothetical protein